MYLNKIRLAPPEGDPQYYDALPAVKALRQMGELVLHAPITFLVGENGSGKSTLLEAVAVAAGFNPEGGSRNFHFATRETHAGLWRQIQLVRGPVRERDGYFLRAESYYNLASNIDDMDSEPSLGPPVSASYGGGSLHEMSHGESFLALVMNRLGGKGLYIFDEPEAALSPTNQLTMLACIHRLAGQGSQFVIATHSPMLMACPGAEILQLDANGITPTPLQQTTHYAITTRFLSHPESILHQLLEDD